MRLMLKVQENYTKSKKREGQNYPNKLRQRWTWAILKGKTTKKKKNHKEQAKKAKSKPKNLS